MIDTIIIDRGHGTLNSKGIYVTKGKQAKLPDGRLVYEGVENQKYCEAIEIEAKLQGLKVEYSIPFLAFEDASLYARVLRANNNKNKNNSLFLSIHNNAANGKAEGTEVFTSKGQTLSDIFAEHILISIKNTIPDRKLRIDSLSDGDLDKEEQFYVLTKTIMPAVLIEYGFFDNPTDYDWLTNPNNIKVLAKVTVTGIIDAIKNLYGQEAWNTRNI